MIDNAVPEGLRKRSFWLAALFTFLTPGLGHFYAGRLKRGIGVAIVNRSILPALAVGVPLSPYTFYVGVLVGFAVFVGSLSDACFIVRDSPQIRLHKWQRWYFYVGFLATAFLIDRATSVVAPVAVKSFSVPTMSMAPTLMDGDMFLVDRSAYKSHGARAGDIIAFKYPRDEKYYYVKRVIGVPGDKIEIKKKKVFRNGVPLPQIALPLESVRRFKEGLQKADLDRYGLQSVQYFEEQIEGHDHKIIIDTESTVSESHGLLVVPPDQYFVLGDNRDYSNDSRFWGFVPSKNIYGKALYIYFSKQPGTYKFQWDRFGLQLK